MLPLRGSSYTHTQSTKIVLRLLFEFGFSSSFCFLIYIFIAIVDCCCSIVKFVAVFCWHSRCFLVENSFISIYNRSTIFNLDCFSLFIHLILSETSFLVRFPLLIWLDWFKEPSSHFVSLSPSVSRSFSISLFFQHFLLIAMQWLHIGQQTAKECCRRLDTNAQHSNAITCRFTWYMLLQWTLCALFRSCFVSHLFQRTENKN